MMTDEEHRRAIHWAAEISARAQKLACDEQDAEFKALLEAKQKDLRCIGCGKEVEYSDHSGHGYFYGGGLLIDTMGYGSTQHDMDRVAVLVCDDCVTAKGVYVEWFDKLHKYFDQEAKKDGDRGEENQE